jgi:hypothetical protein
MISISSFPGLPNASEAITQINDVRRLAIIELFHLPKSSFDDLAYPPFNRLALQRGELFYLAIFRIRELKFNPMAFAGDTHLFSPCVFAACLEVCPSYLSTG